MLSNKELTDYIKNYLENNKTRSAIMLTGKWGSGKSHYIQNVLVPALNGRDDRKCIVVSLYGIKSLNDISKNIYLEIRAKILLQKTEKMSVVKIVGKTILKNIAGALNINVDIKEKDLQKLYESIDLTGKLIVLEDLERSTMDIIEIMGYVNNLVEQDGVKVLLVANEEEIVQYEEKVAVNSKEQDKKKSEKVLTAQSSKYIRIKEKTISDTINFTPDITNTVENILRTFELKYFNRLLEDNNQEIVNNIRDVMHQTNCCNFRAFMNACQKTKEIFEKFDKKFDLKFFSSVFLGIVAFELRLSQKSNLRWDNDIGSPSSLGTPKYPLYKFAYFYIYHQFVLRIEVEDCEKAFLQSIEDNNAQEKINKSFGVLQNFAYTDEITLTNAVKDIANLLRENKKISVKEYGSLANYLIAVRKLVTEENYIDKCKEYMINNLEEAQIDDVGKFSLMYFGGVSLWEDEQSKEYNEFTKQMSDTVKQRELQSGIEYSQEGIGNLANSINSNRDKYLTNNEFINTLDIEQLLQILPECDSTTIANFRFAIQDIYAPSNIGQYLSGDREQLEKFKDGIQAILNENEHLDKIKRLQFTLFIRNLQDIINKLQR